MVRSICVPAFSLLLFGLAGCGGLKQWKENGFKLGPDYRKPCVPVAPDWVDSANDSVVVQRELHPNWWRVFADPTLEHLIQAASGGGCACSAGSDAERHLRVEPPASVADAFLSIHSQSDEPDNGERLSRFEAVV